MISAGELPAVFLIIAGAAGIIPRAGVLAWPMVLVSGLLWLLL